VYEKGVAKGEGRRAEKERKGRRSKVEKDVRKDGIMEERKKQE